MNIPKVSECICKGNLQRIILDTQHLFGRKYNHKGEAYLFVGVLHGDGDYYYVMWNINTSISTLLSCVGNLEGWGYTIIPQPEQKNVEDPLNKEYGLLTDNSSYTVLSEN